MTGFWLWPGIGWQRPCLPWSAQLGWEVQDWSLGSQCHSKGRHRSMGRNQRHRHQQLQEAARSIHSRNNHVE